MDGAVEVRVGQGLVRGRQEHGVAVFRGIPYARPPFGRLRFAAPEPAEPWEGVRPALSYGPPPPQYDRMSPPPAGARDEAEPDCLTLNVWSPDVAAGGLPVMVWFHGGAYVFGQAGDPVYEGAAPARAGVVVVTFNYRVGVEGFAQLAGAPANRGLLDQVAALQWVRRNAAAFGGDPDRVTVFGESAGAGSIAALLAVPAAAGLLRRVVAQSVPGSYFTPELAGDVARAIGARLGSGASAAQLRRVDPRVLVRAADEVFDRRAARARWGVVGAAETVFSPVVDGEVMTCTPWEAVAAGRARELDLLLGHNRDEYRLFMAKRGEFGTVDQERAAWALEAFGPGGARGARAYREAHPGAGAEEVYEQVMSDWLCRVPTVQLLEAQCAAGGAAYAYELRWPAPVFGGRLGACHGLDVPLVFGTLGAPLARAMLGERPPPEAVALSARMRAAWVGFAASGRPGWAQYRVPGRSTKVFDAVDSVAADPLGASRRVWEGWPFGVLDLL